MTNISFSGLTKYTNSQKKIGYPPEIAHTGVHQIIIKLLSGRPYIF
jgi:hypothetical protein